MDMLDLFIIALGVALVTVGLYLFISGKQGDGSRNSNVEGFGIKINVSNPSIILIVIGIGLILVPKFLPNDKKPDNPADSNVGLPTNITNDDNTNQPVSGLPVPNNAPQQTSVYLPNGNWYLANYQENGIDVSMAVTANISFSMANSTTINWRGDFAVSDFWGNISQYYYVGVTEYRNNGYQMSITSTNDPSIGGQIQMPLIMQLDNNGQLHLEYTLGQNHIITHWHQ